MSLKIPDVSYRPSAVSSRSGGHKPFVFAAFLLLVGAALLIYLDLSETAASVRSLEHTREVIENIDLLMKRVNDAETGQRGFLLTGREQYLLPYNAAASGISGQITRLRGLIRDSPAQRMRLDDLEPKISARLAELGRTVALRREQGLPPTLQIVLTDEGQRLMAQIRRIMREMRSAENLASERQSNQLAADARRTRYSVLFGILSAIGFPGFAGVRLLRETERRIAAAHGLRETEARHQLAVDAAELGTWSWNLETGELLWSDRCKQLFGLPGDTRMDYATFESALHPEDRDRTRRMVNDSVANGAEYDLEYRTVWPDGTIRWIHAIDRRTAGPGGKAIHFQGVAMDIDSVRRAEEALRQNERRYAALFANKTNAIAHCRIVTDESGRTVDHLILQVNEAYQPVAEVVKPRIRRRNRLRHNDSTAVWRRCGAGIQPALAFTTGCYEMAMGIRKTDIEGKLARDVFPGIEKFPIDLIGIYGKVAQEGGETAFELYFEPLKRWLSIYAYSPLPGEFTAMFTGITAQKEATEALRVSEERLRLAQTASGIGVWDWSPRTDELKFTPELEQLYGLVNGSVRRYEDWLRLVVPEDVSRLKSERDRSIAGGQPFDLEFRIRDASGAPRWISAKGGAIRDRSGAVSRVLGVNADITERKRIEAELRQLHASLEERVAERTRELAEANRELESFSYSVSHDLRAPLRGIDGFARILVEEYAPALDPKPARYLYLIRDNAGRMGMLIDDLLAFSRLGRQGLKRQEVDTAAMVHQVLSELQPDLQGRKVELIVGKLPGCKAEPAMLKQLWCNLLSNAIKFTRKRESARIEVGCREEEPGPVYFVRDNGAGFDMRYADKLFEIFQRRHRAEDYDGTGVGPAIVARIVSRHGGRVRADARPGAGATFSFSLGGGQPANGDPRVL